MTGVSVYCCLYLDRSNYIAFVAVQNQPWLPQRQVKYHFSKVTVSPCKPASRVTRVYDGLRLMNEA